VPSLRLGTRKSALAQTQSTWVADRLREAFPGLEIEMVLITTSGDVLPSPSPLPEGEGQALPSTGTGEGGRRPGEGSGGLKALFTKEIEEALLDRRIDLAVHSLKDMSAELPVGLVIAAIPEREDPRDAWISREGTLFHDLTSEARIATGSVRRQAQIRHLIPGVQVIPLRGNVDTRLRKLHEESYDGMILAAAGLRRLGRQSEITEFISPDRLLPAVGQGCLAIQMRQDDSNVFPYIKGLDHRPSHQAARAERAFLKALGGSCQTPIAAYAQVEWDHLQLDGMVISPDGLRVFRFSTNGDADGAERLGQELGARFLAAGARELLR
jgi:hydroxymethylbilane synthase